MKLKQIILGALLSCCLFLNGAEAAGRHGALLLVPLDNRPVNCAYAVETLRAAGWDVLLPPAEAIAAQEHQGQPDALLGWLEAHAGEARGAVVSTDAVLYGGLVDSRTHHTEKAVLQKRLERLTHLRSHAGLKRVYAFATIMRSPRASAAPVEPEYYAQYGSQIFRLGELRDKDELGLLTRGEKKEMKLLEQTLPQNVQEDLFGRRATNLEMTRELLRAAGEHIFNTLVIGRDDSARYSQAHLEARALTRDVEKLPSGAVHFFAGADEIGLLLLTRAVCELTYKTPIVYPFYTEDKDAEIICQYEDEPVGRGVREHILAAGAYPARLPQRADNFLGVFVTPESGHAGSSDAANFLPAGARERSFTAMVKKLLEQGKSVTVADVAFGNGSSNPLVYQLFAEKVNVPRKSTGDEDLSGAPENGSVCAEAEPVGWQLAAYGGWNTAGNAMGFALAQGLLASHETDAARRELLTRRYLEDFGYQSNVRMQIYQQLVWPKSRPNSGLTPELVAEYEAGIAERMLPATEPVLGELALNYKYTLPWRRLFEVQVEPK